MDHARPVLPRASGRVPSSIRNMGRGLSEGRGFRRLIEAGGPPSREGAPRGGRKGTPGRDGHEVPAHGEHRDFADGAGRRSTWKHRIAARGGIQAGAAIRTNRLRCRWGRSPFDFRFMWAAAARRTPTSGAALAVVSVLFTVEGTGRRDRGRRCYLPPKPEGEHDRRQ